jgi:basic amino acid/polyamine antiporter, APA family
LGLGSMIGTGVFVSVGIAAGVAGPLLLAATVLAALLAAANGLSSARLAAAHPVSGGTYEYGHRWLSPALGFSAGWMFLLAKSASAATAALGFSGYLLDALDLGGGRWHVPVAVAGALAVTTLVAGGIRRSNRMNAVVVTVAVTGLLLLVGLALPTVAATGAARFRSLLPHPADGWTGLRPLLHGTALMFVAFTGYGRVATLGEEVRRPARVIPRAIGLTVGLVTLLYLAVGAAGVGVLGAQAFGDAATRTAAPLEALARVLGYRFLPEFVAIAAVSAMLGVLLNLVLGLSRVLLAMARRGEAPAYLARVDRRRASPVAAVWACGTTVAALTLVGDVRTTWSFSAFTVLVYYAITNLAALRMSDAERKLPRWVPAVGLMACLSLAFMVELRIWLFGLVLLGAGLVARAVFARSQAGSR